MNLLRKSNLIHSVYPLTLEESMSQVWHPENPTWFHRLDPSTHPNATESKNPYWFQVRIYDPREVPLGTFFGYNPTEEMFIKNIKFRNLAAVLPIFQRRKVCVPTHIEDEIFDCFLSYIPFKN